MKWYTDHNMRPVLAAAAAFLLPLVLFACVHKSPEDATQERAKNAVEEERVEEPESVLEEEDLITRNVIYTGVLEEGGMTIYQEGSHRLMLADGRMVMLAPVEESNLDLDLYIGKLVQVKGDVMPTVEAGGTIMDVSEIHWIRRELNGDGKEHEALRVLCGEGVGCPLGQICEIGEEVSVCTESGEEMIEEGEVEVEEEVGQGEEKENTEEEGEVQVREDEEEVAVEKQEVKEETEEIEKKEVTSVQEGDSVDRSSQSEAIALMIDEDYSEDRWTQEYCSAHLGFCVSVHKNWYYRSFGATADVLSHLEMGASVVEEIGDGPLVVKLKVGALEGLGVEDGAVKEMGDRVVGYRSWSDNRHFEISCVKELRVPVEYVTDGLRGQE